jgi:hypothetical protein
LDGAAYKVELSGAVVAAAAQDSGASDAGASDGSPQLEEVLPHAQGQQTLILGLALGILAVGFAILYRTPSRQGEGQTARPAAAGQKGRPASRQGEE